MVGARGARSVDIDRAGNLVFENAVYSANLFLVDPANPDAKPRELWPSTRYTNQAEFSPDGTRVLFLSNRDGAGAVYVATLDGAPRRILGRRVLLHAPSLVERDGRSVYAVRVTRREDGERVQQAVRANVDAGAVESPAQARIARLRRARGIGDGGVIVGEISGR